jgi:hypothetical protein
VPLARGATELVDSKGNWPRNTSRKPSAKSTKFSERHRFGPPRREAPHRRGQGTRTRPKRCGFRSARAD